MWSIFIFLRSVWRLFQLGYKQEMWKIVLLSLQKQILNFPSRDYSRLSLRTLLTCSPFFRVSSTCWTNTSLQWFWNYYIRRINDEQTVLLLYFLLHGNKLFLSYALARTDLDTLILPLLQILYDLLLQKPQRIYMILIVILILTHDESFCSIVQSLVRYLPTKKIFIIACPSWKRVKFWMAHVIWYCNCSKLDKFLGTKKND